MDSVSPQDVYARSLASRRGYPLWTPEPSLGLPDTYRQQGLRIGDVGVVVPEDGSFDVFFNICLPSTHSLHQRAGVPNNFNLIQLEDGDIAIFPEAESAGRVISTSFVARQWSNEDTTRVTQLGPLNYEFKLSFNEGAVLILPEGAERYYLRNERPFLEEAIHHAVDWYDFAEQRLGRIISHDSLYLITGFYKAASWSLASYQKAFGVREAYARFRAVQVGGDNTWETTHPLDWRVGPSNQYRSGIANQSVFIQGFKIAVRSSILGAKRIKVKAQLPVVRPQHAVSTGSRQLNFGARFLCCLISVPVPNTLGERNADSNVGIPEGSCDSSSILDDAGDDITIQRIPQVLKPFHPSDIINRYLLQSHPAAEIAITHDTQWGMLLESESLKPEEIVQEGRLEALVCNMLPVSRQGVVYLENITLLGGNDVESKASKQFEDMEELSGYVGQEPPRPDAVGTRPREVLNAQAIEVQPYDSSESELSSNLGITTGMFKQRQSPTGPNFVPDTPKPRKLSLREEPCEGPSSHPATTTDMRRRQTPVMPTLSSKYNPTIRQPTLIPSSQAISSSLHQTAVLPGQGLSWKVDEVDPEPLPADQGRLLRMMGRQVPEDVPRSNVGKTSLMKEKKGGFKPLLTKLSGPPREKGEQEENEADVKPLPTDQYGLPRKRRKQALEDVPRSNIDRISLTKESEGGLTALLTEHWQGKLPRNKGEEVPEDTLRPTVNPMPPKKEDEEDIKYPLAHQYKFPRKKRELLEDPPWSNVDQGLSQKNLTTDKGTIQGRRGEQLLEEISPSNVDQILPTKESGGSFEPVLIKQEQLPRKKREQVPENALHTQVYQAFQRENEERPELRLTGQVRLSGEWGEQVADKRLHSNVD